MSSKDARGDNISNRANVSPVMLLASLLLPLAVIAIVLLVQRLHLPVFLAIMATVVVYGIAADMTFMSVGKAFGLGFTAAIEQTGLLVVAGSMVSALVLRQPLGTGTAAAAGALAGLGASATGGLALLQPAGQDAPRRALGLALTLLAFAALATPSPLAVAAASVMKIPPRSLAVVGLPLAVIAALLGWWHVSRQVPASKIVGHAGWAWLAVAVPIGLLIVQAVAQMPSEPLGKGGAREFYIGWRPSPSRSACCSPAAGSPRRWPAAAGRRCCSRSARPAGSAACSTRPAWPSFWPNTRSIRATAS
jgi:GntP family gluconate:H+ symporter